MAYCCRIEYIVYFCSVIAIYIPMKVDLNSGAYIEIGGELGRYNSLPVDVLVKIAKDLQDLVTSIAKHTLPSEEPVDLNNFQLELTGFEKASAVPQFSFSPRSENMSGFYSASQRDSVNNCFNNILQIANTGDYHELKKILPTPEARNPIVVSLYSLTNNFGNSPVSFVDYDKKTSKIVPIYKVNKLKEEVKKELITPILDIDKKEDKTILDAVGFIREFKKGEKTTQRKVVESFASSDYVLGYAPKKIITGNTVYHLRQPLRSLFAKEDDYYIIESELLDIIGTGKNKEEARQSFADEFDFIYRRLNSLSDDQLTERNKLIKININNIVLGTE